LVRGDEFIVAAEVGSSAVPVLIKNPTELAIETQRCRLLLGGSFVESDAAFTELRIDRLIECQCIAFHDGIDHRRHDQPNLF
jgi:hypothetical protein